MTRSPTLRQETLDRLQTEQFDVLVIGGGITGAGITRDAALRGFKVALLEKEDFASGTSSKSARLVHGGFRYLEQYQFGLVMSACAERYRLHRIAPRLVRPLAFTFPIYRRSSHSLAQITAGMWLYDVLALFRNVQRHRILRPEQVIQTEPLLERDGLIGAACYYDCIADDARLTLANVRAAQRRGAQAANYARVCGLLKNGGQIAGAEVVDRISGRPFAVRARVTVNAGGVWMDQITHLENSGQRDQVRVNRGSHLILSRGKLALRDAVAFGSADGRRAMYAVPWRNTRIVGTTDVDHTGPLEDIAVSAAEAEFILISTQKAFPQAHLTPDDVISSFAGLRPLIAEEGKAAYQVSRDHHIFESEAGLISISGGKLTTYRRMAQDVMVRVAKKLGKGQGRSQTDRVPLAEASFDAQAELAALAARGSGLDEEVLGHLMWTYGPEVPALLEQIALDAGLGRRIVPGLPYICAEIGHAIEHEMAQTLCDVLIRRMHIIHEDAEQGLGCAAGVAALMAPHLGWDAAEIERQMAAYRQQVALTRAYRQG